MELKRLRKLSGIPLNEASESIIQDLEKNAGRREKQLESQLEKVLRAAAIIGAELSVIKLGLDFVTDELADGNITSSGEAIKAMTKHARDSVSENEDFFIETFGDEFRFKVEGLVEGEKVKPKV